MSANKWIVFSLAVVLLFLLQQTAIAQVWQWSVPVNGEKGPARAFLWVPENCKKIKGVVVAQNNMEEISILENEGFRQGMSEIGFAEVWVSPFFDHLFNFRKGAGEVFTSFMDSLAQASGYTELSSAPIVGLGHSAAASWPYYFGAWKPERTLACISVSGQWPYFRNPQFAPDIWSKDQNIDFIPALETMGEYEAAATWSVEGLKQRKDHPLMPLSMLAAPGEGHFASSDKKAAFLAFYIKKAAHYRLPKNDTGSPLQLLPIDPTTSGWFADKWRPDQPPVAPAAPVGKYTGDTAQAFWFFDEETVREVEKYEALYRGLKPQLVGFVQEGKMVPQKNTHLQLDLKFSPLEDGLTFQLATAFYDTVPGISPRPTSWTGLPVGTPIGHAKEGGSIVNEKVAGPFAKRSVNTFTLQLEKGLEEAPKNYVFTLVAKHPGDKEYKPAVQQAQMTIPVKISEGEDQTILFSTIPNQKSGTKSLQLKAKSSAGVPVSFYVLDGPAQITGSRLLFTKIPPRAKYPMKVTVVAWQYGLNGKRKVKTAEPVTKTFSIYK